MPRGVNGSFSPPDRIRVHHKIPLVLPPPTASPLKTTARLFRMASILPRPRLRCTFVQALFRMFGQFEDRGTVLRKTLRRAAVGGTPTADCTCLRRLHFYLPQPFQVAYSTFYCEHAAAARTLIAAAQPHIMMIDLRASLACRRLDFAISIHVTGACVHGSCSSTSAANPGAIT